MQYPPLTQFGQTNLAKLHLSLYYNVVMNNMNNEEVIKKPWPYESNKSFYTFNSSPAGQNGSHFPDDI